MIMPEATTQGVDFGRSRVESLPQPANPDRNAEMSPNRFASRSARPTTVNKLAALMVFTYQFAPEQSIPTFELEVGTWYDKKTIQSAIGYLQDTASERNKGKQPDYLPAELNTIGILNGTIMISEGQARETVQEYIDKLTPTHRSKGNGAVNPWDNLTETIRPLDEIFWKKLQESGACRDIKNGDTLNIFTTTAKTAIDRAKIEQAKAICAECPMESGCLQYALAHPELPGVWGRTSEQERTKMRAIKK